MPEPLLALDGVHGGYGPIAVLKGVTIAVQPGEIVALIGANGAGKTTAMLTVSGIRRASAGAIRFAGADIGAAPAHDIVRRGLAHVPEGRRIFPRMSVLENLQLGATIRGHDRAGVRADLDRVFALFPILAERRQQAGGTLSGGEQQMLAIARALMSRPRMLLMDEPSMGVAPILVQRIFATVQRLNQEGMTVLLVEQNARQALAIAHRAYVLETGRITLAGPARDLLDDPQVRTAYLGG